MVNSGNMRFCVKFVFVFLRALRRFVGVDNANGDNKHQRVKSTYDRFGTYKRYGAFARASSADGARQLNEKRKNIFIKMRLKLLKTPTVCGIIILNHTGDKRGEFLLQ